MSYDDFKGKLFLDTHALMRYAAIGRLDRLELMNGFTAIHPLVEKSIEQIADLSARGGRSSASRDVVETARLAAEVLERMRSGAFGKTLHSSLEVQVTSRVVEQTLAGIQGQMGVDTRVRAAGAASIAAAIEYGGATTEFSASSLAVGRLEGIPILSVTDLNVLATELTRDELEGVRVQRLLLDAGLSKVGIREFGQMLESKALIEPIIDGRQVRPYVPLRHRPNINRQSTLYLSTEIVADLLRSANGAVTRLPSRVSLPAATVEGLRLVAESDSSGVIASFLESHQVLVADELEPSDVEDARQALRRAWSETMEGPISVEDLEGLAECLVLARGRPGEVLVSDHAAIASRASELMSPELAINAVTSETLFTAMAHGAGHARKRRIWDEYRTYCTVAGMSDPGNEPKEAFLLDQWSTLKQLDVPEAPLPASFTDARLPIVYPDADFFVSMLELMRDDPDSAERIVRHSAGQLMMTSGVRADVSRRLGNRLDLKMILETRPLAMPVDSSLFSESVAAVRATRLDSSQSAVDRAALDDRSIEQLVIAASEKSGWTVSRSVSAAARMNRLLASTAKGLPGVIKSERPAIDHRTLLEALCQVADIDSSEQRALATAVVRLGRKMGVGALTVERLIDGEHAKQAGIPALRADTLVARGRDGLHGTDASDLVRTIEEVRASSQESTITQWSNKALRTIVELYEARTGHDLSNSVVAHISRALKQREPVLNRSPWRERLGFDEGSRSIDATTAQITRDAWYDTESNAMMFAISQIGRLAPGMQRCAIAAIEEMATRRYLEDLVEDAIDEASRSDSMTPRTAVQERDIRLHEIVGRTFLRQDRVEKVSGVEKVPGMVHAQRAVHRSTQRLVETSCAVFSDPRQAAALRNVCRCVAALSLLGTRNDHRIRKQLMMGIDELRSPSASDISHLTTVTRNLVRDSDVDLLVSRFADTRADLTRVLGPRVDKAHERTTSPPTATQGRVQGPQRAQQARVGPLFVSPSQDHRSSLSRNTQQSRRSDRLPPNPQRPIQVGGTRRSTAPGRKAVGELRFSQGVESSGDEASRREVSRGTSGPSLLGNSELRAADVERFDESDQGLGSNTDRAGNARPSHTDESPGVDLG